MRNKGKRKIEGEAIAKARETKVKEEDTACIILSI